MGRRTERYRSHLETAYSSKQKGQARHRRRSAEEERGYLEQNLGSERQLSGELSGVSSDVAPYTDRFEFDESYATTLGSHEDSGYVARDLRQNAGRANELMSQAEEAARGGNAQKAEQLKQEAEAALTSTEHNAVVEGNPWGSITNTEVLKGAFTRTRDERARAMGRLGSPLGQQVGEMVHQGREFLDRDSETSEEFRSSIADPAMEAVDLGKKNAMRGLAQDRRDALRQQRAIGLQRGAGRSATGDAAIARRTGERFATERAKVETGAAADKAKILSDTNKFFEQYSRKYASHSVQMAQMWINNQSGVRDEYNNAMDKLALEGSRIAQQNAQNHMKWSAESAKHHADEVSRNIQVGTYVLGAALAVTGIGAAAIGAIGGAAAGAGVSAASSAAGGAASTLGMGAAGTASMASAATSGAAAAAGSAGAGLGGTLASSAVSLGTNMLSDGGGH